MSALGCIARRRSLTVREADSRVRGLKAAQIAAEVRDAKRAEDEAAAALAAERAAIQEKLREINQAAHAWDEALTQLVAVTSAYDATVVGLFALHPPAAIIQKIETARSQAMYIIGHRLQALINVRHRPPFFPSHLARLVNHLPPLEAAVTQPAE
jgi:negative regulator of sigma E activity